MIVISDTALIDGVHIFFPARSCSLPHSVMSKGKRGLFEGDGNGSWFYRDRNGIQQAFHFTDRLVNFSKPKMSNVMNSTQYRQLFQPRISKISICKESNPINQESSFHPASSNIHKKVMYEKTNRQLGKKERKGASTHAGRKYFKDRGKPDHSWTTQCQRC